MLYDDFKPVVDLVLNNWTALQLAVEHGMGNPGGKQVYISVLKYGISIQYKHGKDFKRYSNVWDSISTIVSAPCFRDLKI